MPSVKPSSLVLLAGLFECISNPWCTPFTTQTHQLTHPMTYGVASGWLSPPSLMKHSRSAPRPYSSIPRSLLGAAHASTATVEAPPTPTLTPPHHPNEPDDEAKQREFDMQVGAATEVLRRDIPGILKAAPDLSIFRDDVKLSDPSGQKLRGKRMYAQMFRFLRSLSAVTVHTSLVTVRMWYDKPSACLKVKTNAQLWLHGTLLRSEPIHVDLVSHYHFDAQARISHHVVDRVDIDGMEYDPLGFLGAEGDLARFIRRRAPVPLHPGLQGVPHLAAPPEFKENPTPGALITTVWQSKSSSSPSSSKKEQNFDVYGNLVADSMADKVELRNADGSRKDETKASGFFDFLKQLEPDWCESDSDCPGLEVCCDFFVTSVCCGGGITVPAVTDRQLAPEMIPIPVQPPPPGAPGGNGGGGGLPPRQPW